MKNYLKKIASLTLMIFGLVVGFGSIADASNKDLIIGETLNYKISKFGLKVAEASLTYKGPVTLDDKNLLLVEFTATGLKFLDEEKIYLDAETFFPVMIERDLNIFGSEEKITEYYESEKGLVRIVKNVKGEISEQIIEKEGNLENIYGYIYRQRLKGEFKEGETYALRMPTRDVQIEYAKETRLRAAGKRHDAHYYLSNPKKFKLFFDQSEEKIPLRIDGAMGFGNMTMILTGREEMKSANR